MAGAYEFFLSGIEAALANSPFIAGDALSIADIGVACDLSQFLRERLMADRLASERLRTHQCGSRADLSAHDGHLASLASRPVFSRYLEKTVRQTLVRAVDG